MGTKKRTLQNKYPIKSDQVSRCKVEVLHRFRLKVMFHPFYCHSLYKKDTYIQACIVLLRNLWTDENS